jgi:hypothetical protein
MKIVPTEHPKVVVDDCLSSNNAQQRIKQSVTTIMPSEQPFSRALVEEPVLLVHPSDVRTMTNSGTSATITIVASHAQATKPESPSAFRSGRWTLDEKIMFLYALRKFGKGRWKKMKVYLPHR